jgi:hypothetical protein
VTRSIGVERRVEVDRPRLLLACRVVDFPPAALRLDVLLLALRFAPALDRLLALRVLPDALAADRPRDFLLFVPDFALRDEPLLPDFPRDFLALVAIDGLLGVVDEKSTSTIARIRHIRKSELRSGRHRESRHHDGSIG